jgi:hypothetical protein
MIEQRSIVYLLFFFCLVSCQNKHRLSKQDLKWLPYKGNEILVFTTNKNEVDTIYLRGIMRFLYSGSPLDVIPDSLDKLFVHFTFSDPTDMKKERYKKSGTLFSLYKTTKGATKIAFGMETKDGFFYGLRSFNLKEVKNMAQTFLSTPLKTYDDVLIIIPDSDRMKDSNQAHFIHKIYWSKNHGIVRFDKGDNQHWLTSISSVN